MQRSLRFARNFSWNLLGQVGTWASAFLLIPYLVRRMGVEAYGLYLLLGTASSYLLILTFGAGSASVVHGAGRAGGKDGRGLREVLSWSVGIHLGGVALGAVLLAVAAPSIADSWFQVPPRLREEAVWILRCAALGAVFAGLLQAANSLLQGLQRFDWQNMIALTQSVATPLGAGALLAAGFGLRQIGLWYVVVNAVLAVAALAVARGLVAAFPLRASSEGRSLRGFLATCRGFWLAQCASVVTLQFDKLFIGRTLALGDLTLWAVPAGLLMRLQTVPANIAGVIMPMSSELTAQEAEEGLARMYVKTVRAVLWSTLPAQVLLFALMPQFLTLWVGPAFGVMSVWPARVLALAQAVSLLNVIPLNMASARGKPLYLTTWLWLQASLLVLSWYLLAPRLGLLGIALGFLLSSSLPLPFFLAVIHRGILRLPLARYLREALYVPCASAALLLALVFPVHHLATSWLALLALSAAGLALYYGSTWRLMEDSDRALVRKLLRLTA
ncbi:MAG: oligosaccharide flippase family protein [Elusimicrobia bacterium]|nr:oligosaccharide flippase family protein [Elusimicrobiota bacterium]